MFDKVSNNLKILEKSLDASFLRNEVISQNIANADTPNYKRKTVSFEQYLSKALKSNGSDGSNTNDGKLDINAGYLDSIKIRVQTDNASLSYRLDGNNVDIESEMAEGVKNAVRYNTLIQSLNSGYQRLRSVISEGRK